MGDIPVPVTSQPPGGHKHVLGDEKSVETSTLGELAAVDPVAEKKLVRKLDMRILPLVTLAYLLTFLDRANAGNARIAGLIPALGLGPNDFNGATSLYYIFYLIFEIPYALLVKRFGFWIIPAHVFLFSLVTMCTAFITNTASFYAMRGLLGITEAAIFPGVSYMLTRYYKRSEITVRVGFFMLVAASLAQGFGGLLASGLITRTAGKYATWQMIFLVEGIIGLGIAVAMWVVFPTDITTTKMLTEHERELGMRRIISDQPSVRDAAKDKTTRQLIRRAFNSTSLTCGLIYIVDNLTVQGLGIFTPTILSGIYPGSTTVRLQLLSVPPAIVGGVGALALSYVSMRTQHHGFVIIFANCLALIGYGIWVGTTHVEARYAAVFLNYISGFTNGPVSVGWAMSNASPDTIRAVTGALVTGMGGIGSVASPWLYFTATAPSYRPGNAVNLAMNALSIVLALGLMAYQVRENKTRAAGKRNYRLDKPNAHALGFLHPDFRFIH